MSSSVFSTSAKSAGWFVDSNLDRVNWSAAKAALHDDDFDNGRSAYALRMSFVRSQHVALAWGEDELVGMARLLSDGVCNAYLLDVWTRSTWRGRGIATAMVRRLVDAVPGQHVGLQTDDAVEFYQQAGFGHQPHFLSLVAGPWLHNDANR